MEHNRKIFLRSYMGPLNTSPLIRFWNRFYDHLKLKTLKPIAFAWLVITIWYWMSGWDCCTSDERDGWLSMWKRYFETEFYNRRKLKDEYPSRQICSLKDNIEIVCRVVWNSEINVRKKPCTLPVVQLYYSICMTMTLRNNFNVPTQMGSFGRYTRSWEGRATVILCSCMSTSHSSCIAYWRMSRLVIAEMI